jgi:ankyrin repeat protein
VMHWPSHYIAHQDRKSLVQDILDFFALEKPRTQWAQWWRAGQSIPEINDLPMTPIALSAQHGLLEVIQQLLLQSGDEAISPEERTEALEIALHFGHLDVARELLHSLSPSKRAISLAARIGDLPSLKELIEKTEDPHSYALNCLETAAFCGHLGVINTFLKLLPDARTFLNDNASVYRQSVRGGQLHILKRLLEVGTAPLPAETGAALLHLSAEAGDLQMIGLLQTYDVDVNCINEDGQTLLYHAVAAGHARVVAELAPKITPWGVDRDGLSPLHIAAIQGNLAVFMELIKCKPDVTATNNQGDQPIHLAAERGHFDIVVQLLNMGLDPKAANHGGFNLLHLAARGGHVAMVKDLLRRTSNSFSTNTGSNQKWGDQCAENPRVDPRSNLDKGIYDASKESSDQKNDTESKVNEDTEECEEEEGEGEDGDWGQTEEEEEEEEEAVGEEDGDITYEPTPLHSTALKGYVDVIEVLLPHADDTLGNSYGSTPLHLAVRGGHTAAVKYLLSQGSSLGVCDTYGRQPIHLASYTGNLFILQMLLENGSSFEATDDQGNTPLHISTESGHEQLVQALIDIGADVNHKQRGSGGSCLHIAARIGHEGIVKLLTGAGVSLDEQDEKGRTALHVSLTHFREEVATCLLDGGADHNTRDIEDQTPFYSAIINGIDFRTIERLQPSHDQIGKMIESDPMLIHKALRAKQGQRVIALLMHFGWNPLVKDEDGETPLQLALKLGLSIEAEQLLERMNPDIPSIREYSESLIDMAIQGFAAGVRKVLAYAEVDLEVKGGTYHQTPLAFAAENGKNDVVKLLLEKGANPNVKDDDDITPILTAVWNHHKEIITQLIDAKADIDARNIFGRTSLDLAVLVQDAELVSLLLERGASIPNSEVRGVTNILRQSIHKGLLQITEILLRNGANPFEVDSQGQTAIHEAVEAANPAFLEALLRNGTKSFPEGFEWTPLHLAAMVGDTELIRSHKTHAHAKDTKGRTALHWATLRGHLEAVEILFGMQTDLKAQDEDGMTALHLSATQGNIDIVRLLADKGDQCSVQNVDGWSPIHLARSCGYEETVSFLSNLVSMADAAHAGFSPEWVSIGNTTGILVKDDGRQVIIGRLS